MLPFSDPFSDPKNAAAAYGSDHTSTLTAEDRVDEATGTTALACVILAHNDPVQVRRLIDALDPFPVFLHCDENTPPEVFDAMVKGLPERCTVLDRINTAWATWGGVEAELAGYRAALATTDARHIAVLAGSDYPLASSEEIAAVLDGYADQSIALVHQLPYKDWGLSGGFARLRYRHWAFGKRMLRLPLPRRLPTDIVAAGAAPQKILARHHAEAVVAVADARPDLIKFWRRGWAPDETFVPTILNTPKFVPDFASQHEPASAWWIGWSREKREKSPRWLEMDLRDELLSGSVYEAQIFPRLFARKFSTELSGSLLEAIEERRQNSALTGGGWTGYDAAVAQELARTAGRRRSVTAPPARNHAAHTTPPPRSVPPISPASVAATAPPSAPPPSAPSSGPPHDDASAEDTGEPAQESHPLNHTPAVAVADAPVVPLDSAASGAPPSANESSHLFGRGMLYVVVWSLQLVAGTVVSPILAYTLGPAEFGALASAIALHQVLSVLALLGLDQAIVLQRADDPSGRSARGLLAVAIALSFGVTLALTATGGLWASALGFDGFSPLVMAVILWTAPGAVVQGTLALLLAEDRLRAFTWVSALAAVGGQLIGLLLLFFVHRDATTYAWGGVASQFAAMTIGLVLARPRLRGLLDTAIAWRAIKIGVPLAVSSLGYFVLNAGDRIVIQSILGPAEVGRYQVAHVVGYTVVLLLTFTSSAWLPRFAAIKDDAERWRMSAQSRDELYRLLIPVVFAVTLAAPVALRLVAPSSFEQDTLLIVVFLVALTAYPVAAGGASSRLLVTLRRGRTVATITLIAAVVNIILNLALVPVLGIAGSATGTVLAFGVMALLQHFALPREPAWVRTPPALLAGIALSVALAAASMLLPQTLPWNIGKFVIAVSCLPWFFVVLRRARRGPDPAHTPTTRSTP